MQGIEDLIWFGNEFSSYCVLTCSYGRGKIAAIWDQVLAIRDAVAERYRGIVGACEKCSPVRGLANVYDKGVRHEVFSPTSSVNNVASAPPRLWPQIVTVAAVPVSR